MNVNENPTTDIFTLNRQVYRRLRLALSVSLRRQIFFAVCDNINIRNQVASKLHSNLAYPVEQVLYPVGEKQEISTPAYPRLVTVRLNLNDPNPIAQINQWLGNYPPPRVGKSQDSPGKVLPIPAFQIVGVEQLTKQSIAVQRLFLHNLKLSEEYFSKKQSTSIVDSNLLFWVTRPWLYAIQQSAPQFWQYRTGVFIFEGEPTGGIENPNYPQNSSELRSIRLEKLDSSVVEESTIFNYQPDEDNGKSLDNETKETTERENQIVPFVLNIPKLSSFSHINQELISLIPKTLNPNIDEDRDTNWQIKQLLWEIEKLTINLTQDSQEEIAQAYHNLGTLYRLRIEQGDANLDNLMVAIIAYQESLSYDETSPLVPDTLNDLGTLYWMLHRTSVSSQEAQTYIEQSLEFYQLVLKMIECDSQPEIYARVQNNLATAYGDLAKFYQPLENWQAAIKAYKETLNYRKEEMDSHKYASCQNNLGTAYWHLAQHSEPEKNLKQAISAYSSALSHYQAEKDPIKYGMIQNNIGTAYWNLSHYETPEKNLQLAIDFYQEALKYRTPENIPIGCAVTRNNLGTAYWQLSNLPHMKGENRQNLLKLSIETYEDTLTIANSFHQKDLSFDILGTQNNLALAHYQLITDSHFKGDKEIVSYHLQTSLDYFLKTLNGLEENTQPYQETFNQIVKIIRTFHHELGIQGQNLALSKIPGNLIPKLLPRL
ncbi:tetratricopeptide repeat protein [Cylindrospermopsis raciborskii]|uniref:tetratricopeptide repeat protein n=1 Tax=Cylindrospermopsis raciborskii TaxID=77022 RepID=UPI001144B5CC|nr:tetratricopeptide repeat protein [Cylindrospermopsis raciborskii]TPX27259.1 tetratricopeptide repeat protein [Cylindrospermopsis raciborskii GIHE 2018]